jgi:putative toxin-antitoxin system antitoxin component (TIGR02293 family)
MLNQVDLLGEAFMPSHPGDHRKAPHLPWDSLEKSARTYFRASPLERIEIIKRRVPAKYVMTLSSSMKMSKEALYGSLNLARATIDRKVLKKELLNQDESERVLAIARLVGQADSIVRESGTVEGFSAPEWVACWLQRPLVALGGRRPGELMDTADGRELVTDLLTLPITERMISPVREPNEQEADGIVKGARWFIPPRPLPWLVWKRWHISAAVHHCRSIATWSEFQFHPPPGASALYSIPTRMSVGMQSPRAWSQWIGELSGLSLEAVYLPKFPRSSYRKNPTF